MALPSGLWPSTVGLRSQTALSTTVPHESEAPTIQTTKWRASGASLLQLKSVTHQALEVRHGNMKTMTVTVGIAR